SNEVDRTTVPGAASTIAAFARSNSIRGPSSSRAHSSLCLLQVGLGTLRLPAPFPAKVPGVELILVGAVRIERQFNRQPLGLLEDLEHARIDVRVIGLLQGSLVEEPHALRTSTIHFHAADVIRLLVVRVDRDQEEASATAISSAVELPILQHRFGRIFA